MTLDHAKQMAEKGIAWTPTIMAYTYLYKLCKENIEKNGDAPVQRSGHAKRDGKL